MVSMLKLRGYAHFLWVREHSHCLQSAIHYKEKSIFHATIKGKLYFKTAFTRNISTNKIYTFQVNRRDDRLWFYTNVALSLLRIMFIFSFFGAGECGPRLYFGKKGKKCLDFWQKFWHTLWDLKIRTKLQV